MFSIARRETIRRDLAIVNFFMGPITRAEWLSLGEETEVPGCMMYEQIGLPNEAEHLDHSKKNFQR